MLIKESLDYAINEFKKHDIQKPVLKARLIIAFSIGKEKEYLITHDKQILSDDEIDECFKNIQRIIKNEPIQYIIGYQEFMKLRFKVNQNVLIPRQDTEILTQEVINSADKKSLKILDLCTGSGAVAIALSKYLPSSHVFASDISLEALEIARENNKTNKTNVEFVKSDLFENIDGKFDIIVSNPPYIETCTIASLSNEVKKEPVLALDGGKDGLEIYRKIVDKAYLHLTFKGLLCLEIGYNQKNNVIDLINNQGQYGEIYSKKDLYDNDRIVVCRRK